MQPSTGGATARARTDRTHRHLARGRHRRYCIVRGGRHHQGIVARAMTGLKTLGVTPVMLAADNEATAKAIAREAGIDGAQGNLLPEDKLAAVKGLQARHGATAMTGDGTTTQPLWRRLTSGSRWAAPARPQPWKGRRGRRGRRPGRPSRDDSPVAHNPCRALAEHRSGVGHPCRVPSARSVRRCQHVDGRIRRNGCELAGPSQRLASCCAARPQADRVGWARLS